MSLRNTLKRKILPVLVKLEKKLQMDVHYIFFGGGAMAIGQVAVTGIALLTSIAFANLLSKEAYGTYQYILTTGEFLTTFSLIGIGRAAITSVAKGKDGVLDDGFKQALLWGLPSILVGIGMGVYYLYKGNPLFGFGVALSAILTMLTIAAKIYLSFLNGRKLFKQTSTYTVLGILIPGIVMVITLYLTKNIFVLLMAFLLSSAITNLALYYKSRTYKRNDDTDPHLTHEAVHLSIDAIISRAIAYLDRLILFHFAGPAALAEFLLAMNFERQFSHLFKSMNSIAIPKLTNRSFHILQKTLPRKLLMLYAILIPFTICYVLLTPITFHYVFPKYTSSVVYAQVLGLAFLFLPIKVLSDTFISHGKHTELYYITFLTAAPKLLATLIFVPWLGIWGVVASLFTEQIFHGGLLVWFFVKRYEEINHHD
jgi:O-antigen/teichoic acid export membrane protein